VADTRRLLSDWLEPKNHGGDHGLNEHAHSDRDHRREIISNRKLRDRENDVLGCSSWVESLCPVLFVKNLKTFIKPKNLKKLFLKNLSFQP